jgi:hypothetical protein
MSFINTFGVGEDETTVMREFCQLLEKYLDRSVNKGRKDQAIEQALRMLDQTGEIGSDQALRKAIIGLARGNLVIKEK